VLCCSILSYSTGIIWASETNSTNVQATQISAPDNTTEQNSLIVSSFDVWDLTKPLVFGCWNFVTAHPFLTAAAGFFFFYKPIVRYLRGGLMSLLHGDIVETTVKIIDDRTRGMAASLGELQRTVATKEDLTQTKNDINAHMDELHQKTQHAATESNDKIQAELTRQNEQLRHIHQEMSRLPRIAASIRTLATHFNVEDVDVEDPHTPDTLNTHPEADSPDDVPEVQQRPWYTRLFW
jgi:hypothetical protein